MEESSGCKDRKSGLGAYLSPLAVIALSFGYAVGWGAFVMPGATFLPGAGPVGTIIAMLIGVAAMSVFALNYHRMVIRVRGPGGAFAFTVKAFGADHGFLLSWFLILTYVAVLWANATALVLLARYLFGTAFQFGFHYTMAGFDVYFGEVLLCMVAIVFAGSICIFRKRLAVGLHTLLAGVIVAGVVTCFCAALWKHEGGISTMAPAFAGEGNYVMQIIRIFAMMPWAFVGFEAVVNSSGEIRFPVKRMFGLMLAAIIISALVYLLLALLPVLSRPDGYATWADYIGALPNLSGIDTMPVFAAVRKALGPVGLALVGGMMLAAQLTGIFGTFIATSRLMYAMAQEGILPSRFANINKDGTPVNAILFVMCASCAIPFFGRTVTGWPVDVSNLGAAVAYGYTSAAAFTVTDRSGEVGKFIAKAAALLGIVMSIVFCLLMLVPNYISGSALSTEAYLLLAIWCILGFLLYRHVFRMDGRGRFGHSTVVWISVLVVIFFASLMWLRLAVCDAAEDSYERLMGKMVTMESLAKMIGYVKYDMLRNAIIELCLLVSSLMIMLSLFSILRKREKALVLAKLDAEKSASKSRSYFFSTVSHDIRTPLNAIIGFSQMLKMGFKTDDERNQAVDAILVSGKTLLCLINDVLDFSKLESGRMEINPVPTDCKHLMNEIVESFRIANRKAELEIRCKIGEIPVLMVDPQRIRQMLFNFVGNAAKFTKSGFIEVRASFETDDIKLDQGVFHIEVEDTGIGISEDDLKRISQPYVQVRSTASRHGGTGLGLSICRQLAVAMGGELTMKSVLGKGSTFIVTIPNVKVSSVAPVMDSKMVENEIVQEAAEHIEADVREIEQDIASVDRERSPNAPGSGKGDAALPVAQTDAASPVPSAGKRRVLIVDDQKMNLMVLKAMLTKLGSFDIVMAADGKKALDILTAPDAPAFDLVLTDMWMPEMDGAGLVKAIRADARLASLPVYVVTADVEMLKQFEAAGFTGVALKPITVDKLKNILQ